VSEIHIPVLRSEIIERLAPRKPGLIIDATLGLGGHAAALLGACPECSLLGIDRDPDALDPASERLRKFPNRCVFVCSPFDRLPSILAAEGLSQPMAILADLGCSSLQLDRAERGFAFSSDGPLDMRMGKEGPTAADFVNTAEPADLLRVLYEYGEERRARSIVRAIVRRREEKAFERTSELAEIVLRALGRGREKIHPATRTFQALRIAVNDELRQLENFIGPAVESLAPGGRIGIISFHSLEDRIVKRSFRRLAGRDPRRSGPQLVLPPPPSLVKVLTPRPIRPSQEEVRSNPRSRSARLRVAEKIAPGTEEGGGRRDTYARKDSGMSAGEISDRDSECSILEAVA